MTDESPTKEPTEHRRMMQAVESRVGLPNPVGEAAASKWLREHGVSVEVVEMFLDEKLKEAKDGKWIGSVSLQVAKKHIGTWMAKKGLRGKQVSAVQAESSLTEEEARELYDLLPEEYNYQRELLKRVFGF